MLWAAATCATNVSTAPKFIFCTNPSSKPWRLTCGMHWYTLSLTGSGPKTHAVDAAAAWSLFDHGDRAPSCTPFRLANFNPLALAPGICFLSRYFRINARDLCISSSVLNKTPAAVGLDIRGLGVKQTGQADPVRVHLTAAGWSQ